MAPVYHWSQPLAWHRPQLPKCHRFPEYYRSQLGCPSSLGRNDMQLEVSEDTCHFLTTVNSSIIDSVWVKVMPISCDRKKKEEVNKMLTLLRILFCFKLFSFIQRLIKKWHVYCIPRVLTECSLAPPLILFPLFIIHIPWVRSPGGQVGKALTPTLFLPE